MKSTVFNANFFRIVKYFLKSISSFIFTAYYITKSVLETHFYKKKEVIKRSVLKLLKITVFCYTFTDFR